MPEWTPSEKQNAFLDCKADELLYGGAAGGGKTWGLLHDAILHCKRYPGASCLIVRRKMVDMTRVGAIISTSRKILAGCGWKWNGTDHFWASPDGSVIQFAQAQNDDYTEENFQGAAPEYLGLEEAGQLSGFQIDYLIGRVRPDRPGVPTKIRLTANPGGRGHKYLKARFIDPVKPLTVWTPPSSGSSPSLSRCFIPALLTDNPALMTNDPTYQAKLENLPEPYRSAYLFGNWDIFLGQFFADWSENVHTCKPFDIPSWWPRIGGFDWGYNHPTVIYWAAVGPDGVVYIYREVRLRFAQVDGDNGIAARIKMHRDGVGRFSAGNDIFTRQHASIGGPTIADQFQKEGVPVFSPTAGRTRVHGWQQVRRYLHWQDDDKQIPGRPLLRVLDGTCPYLLKCLPNMQFSETDSEDMERVDIDPGTGEGGDDEASALMHLLMQRPWIGTEPKTEPAQEGSPAAYRKQRQGDLSKRKQTNA